MAGPEAKIQSAVVEWARKKFNLIARKFQAGRYGTNGWPDYEFILPGGYVVHVEFKAPGGKCTPLQLQRHTELRNLGHCVYVIDDVEVGKRLIALEMRVARRVEAENVRKAA